MSTAHWPQQCVQQIWRKERKPMTWPSRTSSSLWETQVCSYQVCWVLWRTGRKQETQSLQWRQKYVQHLNNPARGSATQGPDGGLQPGCAAGTEGCVEKVVGKDFLEEDRQCGWKAPVLCRARFQEGNAFQGDDWGHSQQDSLKQPALSEQP